MYQCKECKKPITEFDAIFYKKFYNDASMSECKCYKCMTKGPLGEIIIRHKAFKKYSWLCWMTWVSLVICAIGVVMMLSSKYHELYIVLMVIGGYSVIGFWIAGAIKTIRSFNLDLDSVSVGYHYETTYTSSSTGGTFTTSKVSDYCDGEDAGKAFGLGISFPFWCVPYFIYRNVKYANTCPKEVRKALKAANKQAERVLFKESFLVSREAKIKKYNDKIKNIRETYALMGEDVINKKLSKVKEPKFGVITDKKIYLIEELCGRYNSADIVRLKDTEKGSDEEKILFDGYFLYTDGLVPNIEEDWMKVKEYYHFK